MDLSHGPLTPSNTYGYRLQSSTPTNLLTYPHEGIAVVGVIQMLLGTQKPTLMALQAKANSWEVALHTGFIPWPLAWTALQSIIWPSLQYPLAVTSFSMTQA